MVGTAHLSNNSNYQVLDIIQQVQPDRVMVELCPERQGLMYAREEDLMNSGDLKWSDIVKVIKTKGIGAAIIQGALMGATDHVRIMNTTLSINKFNKLTLN